nr:MAG TPA: hypothetical protein [Caudoviricetes sp.]
MLIIGLIFLYLFENVLIKSRLNNIINIEIEDLVSIIFC